MTTLPVLTDSPIQLIQKNTAFEDTYITDHFMGIIKRIYQYEIFKPLLDLTVTLIKDKRLKFKVAPRKFYELDEGNCLTIEGGVFDKILGKFKSKNNYVITIKKNSSDVIIHEIGHMVEKELRLDLQNDFKNSMTHDLRNFSTNNLTLKTAVEQIMIKEVNGYKNDHRLSELFTRYFQLIAMAKEVAGFTASYAYTVSDVNKAFIETEKWIWDNFYKNISSHIDPEVAYKSNTYIKKIEDIKHKWTDEKIIQNKGTKPWSKTIKSIKDY